jgi:hypothetical protein
VQVHLPPALYHDDGGNRDGEKSSNGGRNLDRNNQGEERHSNQAFDKAESGPNQSGEKHDQENPQCCSVHHGLRCQMATLGRVAWPGGRVVGDANLR